MASPARRGSRSRRVRLTITSLSGAAVALSLGWASGAQATMRIVNRLDPAGDPTAIPYTFSSPTFSPPRQFSLGDGSEQTYGGDPGPYTAQALPPAGWRVADIQCVGPRGPGDFVIDVPNQRVTMTHVDPINDNQTCAFTVRRSSASAGSAPGVTGGGAQTPGVTPAPPASELPSVVVPRKTALLAVGAGRRFATASIRSPRRAVVKARLTWHRHVLGTTRIERGPGTYAVRVSITSKWRARLKRAGRQRVTATLRIVVREIHGPTTVFDYGVIVRL